MERVAGIQTAGSERAFDLYIKTRYLHQQHPGHGVTFATGRSRAGKRARPIRVPRGMPSARLEAVAIPESLTDSQVIAITSGSPRTISQNAWTIPCQISSKDARTDQ